MLQLPREERSLWREEYPHAKYPELIKDEEVDIAIIGGGITGMSAGYLLKRSGLKVAVIEKRTIGAGTTGRTTGKVTSQHSLIYHKLQKQLGKKTAQLYGHANQTAVKQINNIILREKIDCDWQRQDNYVFTSKSDKVKQFIEEAKTAAGLGLPASFENKTPLPFEIKAAVKFADQGKLHSQKYIAGLARSIEGNGSHIFENSQVIGIRDRKPCRVRTKNASVIAKNIIVATNVPTLPLIARGSYCLLEYPTESYIVAGKLKDDFEGMYISPDNRHYSILPVNDNGKKLLLIGGEGHISGLRDSKYVHYLRLAEYAKKHFGIRSIEYHWSDRDYMSYDNVPLIGKLYPWSKNLYVGTAYSKWGLTSGTVAAMILHDLIVGRKNPWSAVFDSTRLSPVKSIPKVAASYAKKAFK